MFNLAIFGEQYFYRLQKEYLYPVIHTNYVRQQEPVTKYLRGNQLHLSGIVAVTVLDIVPNMAHILLWTMPLTLDYSLVQVTETGSFVAMEKENLHK